MMSLKDLWRIILHFPVGVLIAFAVEVSGVLSVLIFLCFIIYEVNEDFHIKDSAFKDILGALLGLFAGAIALVILKLCGIALLGD